MARLSPQLSMVRLDDSLANSKPNPHPAVLGSEEWFEDPSRVWKAMSTIGDLDEDPVAVATRAHLQLARMFLIVGHRFDCVAHEVDENLTELVRMAKDDRKGPLDMNLDIDGEPPKLVRQ